MKLLFPCLLIFIFPSCKHLLDVGLPDDKIVSASVYAADKTAAAVLTGLYFRMSSPGGLAGGTNSITLYCGSSADELTLHGSDPFLLSVYENGLTSQETPCWTKLYEYIYQVNTAIEGLSASTTLTTTVKQHLLGEAKFIRAFCYFYLINFFGEVPLLTSGDYKINMNVFRTTSDKVYDLMISDLTDAQQMLTDNYLDATVSVTTFVRVRPNKWAAAALLSRVYLYTGQWAKAVAQAEMVIDQHDLYDTVSVRKVFQRNNEEVIWQLATANEGANTEDALLFVLTEGVDEISHPVSASPFLLSAFEQGDLRRKYWIGENNSYYYPHKYTLSATGSGTDYLVVLRLAEQYLIRAEARLALGDLQGARADVNIIRHRAGLGNTHTVKKEVLSAIILRERQVELFAEWGHRWLDLKRSRQVDAIMKTVTPAKGGTWKTNQQLYPIPESDRLLNTNLSQNPGY